MSGQAERPPEFGRSPDSVEETPRRILVVDDDPDTRRLVGQILQRGGYPWVDFAATADEALERLTGNVAADPLEDRESIDLVLMDVGMAGIDGIEACRQLKADERCRDIPVIMVTGHTGQTELKAAFDAGAVDFVTKPLHRGELLARVNSAMRLKAEMDRRKAREQELLRVTRELADANERLEALSRQDSLTGIANRRQFDEFLDREWARAARQQVPLSLLIVDIDFFKGYNDVFGHQPGDECLRLVAEILERTVNRRLDLMARYGGEEFAAVLPDTDLEGALTLAEKMRAAVVAAALPRPPTPTGEIVTISVGAAGCVPQPGTSPADLIVAADRALYSAKRGGRNRVARAR